MSQSKVAKIYAESLYDFAVSGNSLAAVTEDIGKVQWLFSYSVELLRTVKSPIVKPSDKLAILRDAVKGSLSVQFDGFLTLLCKKNRIDRLPEILQAFAEIRDEKEGILRVTVVSAVALTPQQIASVSEMLGKRYNKTIEITAALDESLIGGFIVKVGDDVIDASMFNKLEQFKKKFINTSISLN